MKRAKSHTTPPKIITITGASGVGKTTIVKKLLELKPDFKLVVSLSTRKPRLSDLPGEYICNMQTEEFDEKSEFLWVVEAHGNRYGTLRESVGSAIFSEGQSIMILVPETVTMLRAYTKTIRENSVLSFYVMPPPEKELRRRLELRGENEETVNKRIEDCRDWNERVGKSNIPYIQIPNNEDKIGIEKAAAAILYYMGSHR